MLYFFWVFRYFVTHLKCKNQVRVAKASSKRVRIDLDIPFINGLDFGYPQFRGALPVYLPSTLSPVS